MPAPARRGSPVPLIIFIVLFVFSAVGLVLVAMELADARHRMNDGFNPNAPGARKYDQMPKLKYELQRADERFEKLDETYRELVRLVGTVSADKLKGEMQGLVQRIEDLRDVPGEPTLLTFVEVLGRRNLEDRDSFKKLIDGAETRNKDLERRLGEEQVKLREKQKLVDERDKQIDGLNTALEAERTKAKKEIDSLTEQVKRLELAKTAESKKLNEKIDELNRYIDKLTAALDDVRTQARPKPAAVGFNPDAERPDGEVLLVDDKAGVIVNIGRRKGGQRGLKFDVYTQKADGTRIKRGEIELTVVQEEISRATLVGRGNPVDVVFKGDILINPAFEPGGAKIFVADTVISEDRKQIIRELLAQYGSRLEDEVTVRTDYLIVSSGEQRGKHLAAAEQLRIPLIREQDLVAFIGR